MIDQITSWWQLLPFSTHRVQIKEDIWTMDGGVDAARDLRSEIVIEQCGGSLTRKSVLDLGCLEGGFTVHYARLGASESVGIEARRISFDRCELLRKLIGLDNVRFVHGDVNEELATGLIECFDVVLLLGLLYHMDNPLSLLRLSHQACRGVMLLDTHVADSVTASHGCSGLVKRSFGGKEYWGRIFPEYPPSISQQKHDQLLWAAWSNRESFWLLDEELLRMLDYVGFRRVIRVDPAQYGSVWQVDQENRVLFVCTR